MDKIRVLTEIETNENGATARLVVPFDKSFLENNADAYEQIDVILADAAEEIIALTSGLNLRSVTIVKTKNLHRFIRSFSSKKSTDTTKNGGQS